MKKLRILALIFMVVTVIIFTFPSCSSDYKLSFTSNPAGAGTFSPAADLYTKGLTVNVQAIPSAGYRFDHWAGGAAGSSPNVQITMDKNKNLIAYFVKTYTLSATSSPNVGGTVSPSTGIYDEGSSISLIASPNQYYQFNGWAGDVSDNSDHLTLIMNSNKNIVASFKKLQFSLQTNVNIPDSGTIQPGAGSYEAGTSVQVAAVPAQGYRFDHWGGGINSTVNHLNLMMDNNKTLTAYFVKIYNLTVNTPPNIGATVKGVGSYDAGTKTTISAKASVCPYAFDHWSGTDNDSINPTTVTMNGDKSVTVYFKQLTAGQAITKSARDTSNATDSISIPLNQYEWVSGQANGGDCHGYIKSPDGSTIADLGSISATANFSFNADVSGNYIIVIQTGGNTLGFYNYTVTYTVYHY